MKRFLEPSDSRLWRLLALLWLVLAGAGFAVTFGSLAMATAIFLLPRE